MLPGLMEDEVVELRLLTTILVHPSTEAMVHTIAIIAVVAKFVTTEERSSSANNGARPRRGGGSARQ